MLSRNQVKQEHKWRLEDIFVSLADWNQELVAINKDMVAVLSYKGRLKDADTILACFNFLDAMGKRIEKLYCYAMMYKDVDLTDTMAAECKSKAQNVFVSFNAYTSFVTPELSNLAVETLEEFIADTRFKNYDYSLKNILKSKAHILSEAEERLLALSGKTLSAFSDIFSQINNVDLKLPKVNIDGKPIELSHGNYGMLLQHNLQDTRKKVYKAYYKAFEGVINTIAANFGASINKDNFLAAARNHKSAREKSVFNNDVPVAIYDKLLQKVDSNLSLMHDYMHFRKKVLKLENLCMYDLHVPMFDKADIKLPYDKAYDLMVEGLEPMGAEYRQLLIKAKNDRWIDVEETANKRSGAYCCGVYGAHPYVLLNYTPTTNDIFTIAHEMGHALHSYYSDKTQPYGKNDYSIFVAEVASTVNEVLLLKHLLKTQKEPHIKKYLLSYYLDMFRTTLFRQSMFAEFEATVHAAEQKGVPLTVDYLNKTYNNLNKKFYGNAVTYDKSIRLEWARIPHFYSSFYVYQYATGLTSAINIANSILSGETSTFDRYKKFLSAGGHKSPFDILKDAGVDLLTDAPYDIAFDEFRKTLDELKALV